MVTRRSRSWLRTCLGAALSVLLVTARAQEIAIVPAEPTAETIVGVSPVIFTGIVSELRYDFHPNSRVPFTFIRFAGVEYLRKDSPVATEKGNSIEISVAGGIRDNLHIMEVDELPKFALGNRYLVFLRGGGWRLSPIAGFEAGVFRLHGSLKADASIIDYRGRPLGGVREGRFVMASPLKEDPPGQDRFEGGARESSPPAALDRELRSLSDRLRGRSQEEQEQFEMRLRERERQQVQKEEEVLKEEDRRPGGIAGYGRVMRLSEMKSYIDSTVTNVGGKYREFSTLHLTPATSRREGSQAVPPRRP